MNTTKHWRCFKKMKSMAKKGATVGDIWPLALVLIVTTIGLAFGADVQSDISADFSDDSYADNITDAGLEATQTFGDKLDTVALVIVAAIIIGLLVREFMTGRM